MNWAVYAILHSICRAFFVETNRVYKVDSWHLTFLQALFGLVVLLPFTPLMYWPADHRFYFAAVIVALITAVGYMIQLALAAQKTGRVSGMYMPLEALTATLVWVLIMPAMLYIYTQNVMLSGGLVVALVLSIWGMSRIRQSDISWSTFIIVAPVGITYAISGIATKIVMPEIMLVPALLTYAFVGFAVMTFALGLALLLKKKASRAMLSTRTLQAGALTGTFSLIGSLSFIASVTLAPNPGYTSIVAMMLPVWLLLFHKIMRVEDTASRAAACMITLGTVILLFATAAFY